MLLSSVGIVAAVILFVVSKKFYVYEDPLIAEVDEVLPAANCGGCGSPGCKAFAEKLVNSDDISDLFCPVGGNDVMKQVSEILGKEVAEKDPTVDFDAMYMDESTGLPVIITDKCTSCGACVKACPRDIIEMRPRNKRDLKIFVGCLNEDKGGIAKKSCDVACIGCSKCEDVCPKGAITMNNNLAYIDPVACSLCRKCVDVCPTHSIIETNFPPKKVKIPKEEKPTEEVVAVVKESVESVNPKTDA